MTVRLFLLVCAVLLASCSKETADSGDTGQEAAATQDERTPAGPAKGLPEGALRVEPGVIVDYTGFEQPMAAMTLFLPTGWRTEGGVEWGSQHMCTNGYAFHWRAISPDGLQTLSALPQHGWSQNNYGAAPSNPGCRIEPFTTVRQYLEAVVQNAKPGATVVTFRPRTDLAQQFAQLNTVTPMPLGEIRQWVEAGELIVAYTENGREMRGLIDATVLFNLSRSNAGMGEMTVLNGYAYPAWAATAPKESFNPALIEALRRSIKANPAWEQRIAGHNTAIARTALEESRKRAQIIAQYNEDVARIRQEAWTAQQESADRRAREFGEVIRGVETYKDENAPGGTVELSHNYDQAWRLKDGSYVLTNDKSFDPWRDLQVEGQKLDAAP